MVTNRTQQPPPPLATHCLYILYFGTGKRGRELNRTRKKVRGATVHNAGSENTVRQKLAQVQKLFILPIIYINMITSHFSFIYKVVKKTVFIL
jgi:hypothetical protein